MRSSVKALTVLTAFFIGIWVISSCKKEEEAIGTDKQLYDLATATTGFTWFENSDVLLDKSAGSGHPQPFLKTRYNAIAAAQLDANGRIKSGAVFPEGSLIVKELYANATTITRYAILYKKSDSPDADSKGWVWGYIDADEKVAIAASAKGAACTGCHSQADNIDYMLMNKYF